MKRMSKGHRNWLSQVGCALVALLLVAGCQKNDPSQRFTEITATPPPMPSVDLSSPEGGVPVQPGAAVTAAQLADKRTFSNRKDPFALLPSEANFDISQTTDRLLAASGFAAPINPPTLDMGGPVEMPLEPVPRWRLSGVIVGDGVMGLLDTGSKTYQIVPGMTVPGTEWYVVSIDRDKAVLARDSNKRPKQFEVGLQGPIGGAAPAAGGAAGGGAGGNSGRPGGGPGLGGAGGGGGAVGSSG